jgi:Lar family restriction alleviation protein
MAELKPCPFCGNKDVELRFRTIHLNSDLFDMDYYYVECHNCYGTGPWIYRKYFAEWDKDGHTVQEMRKDTLLRAKLEAEYDEYEKSIKQQAIDAWNKRSK